MLKLAYYASIVLLLISLYTSFYYVAHSFSMKYQVRSRLYASRRSYRWLSKLHLFIEALPVIKNIVIMLESIGSHIKVKGFLRVSMIMVLIGMATGGFVFTTVKAVCVLALIFGIMPYVALRMVLMSKQMKARLDFLPAIEIFYQRYVLSPQKNLRVMLSELLQEDKFDYPIKALFEQLDRNLAAHRSIEESLRVFAMSLGHHWAEYYVNMLRVGLTEGIDLSHNLRELISDMRKAQRNDQAQRNRLLEIRIANFTPLLFLITYLGINFKVNYNSAYYYYLVDSTGKNMLLNALILIFISFLMGVYLSIKRM